MPIPTNINDLSVTPELNFPEGSDTPDVIDNVFREHAAYIAQLRDRPKPPTIDDFRQSGDPDDTLAITRALATGQPVLAVSGKTYNHDPIFHTGNAVIGTTGEGAAIFNCSVAAPGNHQLFIRGSEKAATTLSANAPANTQKISVANASNIVAGDLLRIVSPTLWPNDNRGSLYFGQLVKVTAKVGTLITLESTIVNGLPSGSVVVPITPIKPRIKNIVFRRPKSTGSVRGVNVSYADGGYVDDCGFENLSRIGLSLTECYKTEVNRPRVVGSNLAVSAMLGYGVGAGGSFGAKIKDGTMYECRRGVDIGGTSIPSFYCEVEGNTVQGGGIADDGVSEFWPVGAVQADGIGSHGGAEGTIYRNNTLINVRGGTLIRGRKEVVVGNTYVGVMQDPVSIIHGSGIEVSGNRYRDQVEYALEDSSFVGGVVDAASTLARPARFVYVNVNNYQLDSGLVVKDNDAKNIRDCVLFLDGGSGMRLKKLRITGNHAVIQNTVPGPVYLISRNNTFKILDEMVEYDNFITTPADHTYARVNFIQIDNEVNTSRDSPSDLTLRNDLALSGGSGLVGFMPAGTGAVATNVQTALRQVAPVNVRRYGAVGDGVADDTAAIQAAINQNLSVSGSFGDVYRITAMIDIPSNRYLDFNGATIKRDFPSAWAMQNFNANKSGAGIDANITIKNIRFIDCGKTDATDFGGALRISYCNNVSIENLDVLFTSTQPTTLYGAWSVYFSGKNITATNIKINNVAQGQQADGIHFGYVENFVLSDFNIVSGDDAISIFPPPRGWSFTGENKASENIVIGNGYVSSPLYAAFKIGAHSNTGDAAPTNCVIKNLLVHDVAVGPVGSGVFIIEDHREDADIAGQYENMVFDNVRSVEQSAAFYGVAIFRDGGGVKENKRFKNIIFSNVAIPTSGTSHNLMRLNSVERLTFRGCDFSQQFGAATANTPITTEYINELVFDGCNIKTHSTTSAALFRRTKATKLFNTDFTDVGNGFRGLQVFFNTDYRVSFWAVGGSVTGYQRAIDSDNSAGATNLLQDFVISGAHLSGTFVDITSTVLNAVPSGLNIRDLLKRAVFSTGAVGGSGSGGVGNQYVSMTIGGITYKLLHDGTI